MKIKRINNIKTRPLKTKIDTKNDKKDNEKEHQKQAKVASLKSL